MIHPKVTRRSIAGRLARDLTASALSEPLFRSLLQSAPDAIIIVDQTGEIVFANAQTERLLRYTEQELVGQPVELLLPERHRVGHRAHRRRFFVDPTARSIGAGRELSVRRKDGSELPAEISLSPLVTEDGTLVSAAIRDVAERRRAEETRRRLAAIIEHTDDAVTANGHEARSRNGTAAPSACTDTPLRRRSAARSGC